jgi:hypothetical protein
MIIDGAGGECTFMWNSYHPVSLVDQGVPQKYRIGKVRDYEDFYDYSGNFYRDIKVKVEKAIPRDKRQNDWRLFVKGALLIVAYCISLHYYIVNLNILSVLVLGVVLGQVGVNIMHDGNHMAFSSNKYVSFALGYALDLLFSSGLMYRRLHVWIFTDVTKYF